MAMHIEGNKLYILVADSDAIKENKISNSTNSDSETTNYCPPEAKDQNKLFYNFLGDEDELQNKPIYLKASKLKFYKQQMITRIKNKYAKIYKGEMQDFEEKCDKLIAQGDIIISNRLILTGDRPYFNFDNQPCWRDFKNILYSEATLIVIEKNADKFYVYPEFHPMFIKPNEINWCIESSDNNDTKNENTSQDDYIKFKKLLGWFVKQLNINNGIEEGARTTGQGYKEGSSIRENYLQWRDYGNFTLDCNFSGGAFANIPKLNYINKTDSGINIRPLFDSNTKEVVAVYLDLYEEEILSKEEIYKLKEQKYDITALSLFDECEPNDLLKELFDKYKELIEQENYKPICISKIKYKTNCIDEIKISDNETIKAGRNRIFFGAPGTGKSHELDKQVAAFAGDDYERVTFHPEYTHSGFFGTYKPIPNPQNPEKITYAFIAGPFLRVLTKALVSANSENNKQPYVLLIEEINRANMAAVFGEVFQLLDRESDASSKFLNASKYFISPSEDVKKYLVDEFSKAGFKTTKEAFNELRIPDNMFIWASMNSADQGVFPMDTAFKRRWEFEYFDINKNEEKIKDFSFNINGEKIKWNALRKAINQQLTKSRINEDKLMGPFFIGKNVFKSGNNDEIIKTINNKVIMYLFEDAARQKRPNIFEKGNDKTYYQICENFKNDGIRIFTQDIVNLYEINIKQKES